METTAAAAAAREADEPALIERARARDEEAFGALVERHRDRAYALALRILRSPADAEEVAQDAFVRAWLALPGFRGEASFATWLHRIVARRALDRAESLRRRRTRETEFEAERQAEPADDSGDDPASRARRLERALGTLGAMQRAVITLFYYEDHSVDRVAATLALPVGTVKTHLARARAALRAAWSRAGGVEVR